MRYHQSDATFKKYQDIIILKEWFFLFRFDTAKLALRKVGLKMLPFIICLLIKKSKEGHILCRLVHNGLKIFLKQFLTLMPLHFYVKIDSKEESKLKLKKIGSYAMSLRQFWIVVPLKQNIWSTLRHGA